MNRYYLDAHKMPSVPLSRAVHRSVDLAATSNFPSNSPTSPTLSFIQPYITSPKWLKTSNTHRCSKVTLSSQKLTVWTDVKLQSVDRQSKMTLNHGAIQRVCPRRLSTIRQKSYARNDFKLHIRESTVPSVTTFKYTVLNRLSKRTLSNTAPISACL